MTLEDVYRETILEHNERPRNKRPLLEATGQARGYSPICGDDITVFVRTDGDRLAEATFTGRSCAICQASASMMTDMVTGRSLGEVEALAERVKTMLTAPDAGDDFTDLGEIEALQGVRRLPLRVKCATLSWNALQAALTESAPGSAAESPAVGQGGSR